MTLGSSLSLALGCLYAAREMHILLLHFVLRWPMELFDTIPMGRILNRFSKDVDACDNTLPAIFRGLLMTFFGVIFYLLTFNSNISKSMLKRSSCLFLL